MAGGRLFVRSKKLKTVVSKLQGTLQISEVFLLSGMILKAFVQNSLSNRGEAYLHCETPYLSRAFPAYCLYIAVRRPAAFLYYATKLEFKFSTHRSLV